MGKSTGNFSSLLAQRFELLMGDLLMILRIATFDPTFLQMGT